MKTSEVYELPLADLKAFLGIPAAQGTAHLKKALKGLVGTTLEWNILKKDAQEWGVASLLAECLITHTPNSATVKFSFPPSLRERLADPKMFAKINLLISNRFTNKHALALYGLAVDIIRIDQNYGYKKLSIAEIRKLFGLEEDEYKELKAFNQRLLKKAVHEVNTRSDLNVEVVLKKELNKIIGYEIHASFKPEEAKTYQNAEERKELPQELINQAKTYMLPDNIAKICEEWELSPLAEKLQESIQLALLELKEEHLADYLLQIVSGVKNDVARGRSSSPSGLFIHRIKNQQEIQLFKEKYLKKEQEYIKLRKKEEEEACQKAYKDFLAHEFQAFLEQQFPTQKEEIYMLLMKSPAGRALLRNTSLDSFGIENIQRKSVKAELLNYQKELRYTPSLDYNAWRKEAAK